MSTRTPTSGAVPGRRAENVPSVTLRSTVSSRPKPMNCAEIQAAWESSGLAPRGNVLLAAGCTEAECSRALGHRVEGVKGLGYLNDLRAVYAASDAVVLPSDHEGFPYSLLEGAAAGRPLVGTDIPGIQCAIRRDETGLLVPLRDAAALRRAIETLASNPELGQRLGARARARVEREFARRIVLQSLLDYYKTELRLRDLLL